MDEVVCGIVGGEDWDWEDVGDGGLSLFVVLVLFVLFRLDLYVLQADA